MSVHDISKARKVQVVTSDSQSKPNLAMPGEPSREPKGMLWDPFTVIEQMGYKDRHTPVTFDLLRRMAHNNPVASVIINTRVDQCAAFAKPSHDRYDYGFKFHRRGKPQDQLTPAEHKWSEQMTSFLLQTGTASNPRSRDSFEHFIRMFMEDSLTYDQAVAEIVPDKVGRPTQFLAHDATQFRLADSTTMWLDPDDDDTTRYVQVYDSQVIEEFNQNELCFGIRNPTSDIRKRGYGQAELEDMAKVVTATLWAWEYNQKMFCTAPGTLVATTDGWQPIETLVGESFEVQTLRGIYPARAFETGHRPLARTVFHNGLSVDTSPEHRFRVIDSEGRADWCEQSSLSSGDWVLGVAPELLTGGSLPSVGKTYEATRSSSTAWTPSHDSVSDSELWEVLGFALCDGHWDLDKGLLQIFLRGNGDDSEVGERVRRVVNRYKLNCIDGDTPGSDGTRFRIFQKPFTTWLRDLGFHSSRDGKRIPGSVFKLPAKQRSAFMRGMFSADGCTSTHVTGYRTPQIDKIDSKLRQDILRCLWSLGVASAERKSTVRVQDVLSFVERVGFIQAYKNEGLRRGDSAKSRWDKLCPTVAKWTARAALDAGLKDVDGRLWELARKVARGVSNWSRARAVEAFEKVGLEIPEELQGSNFRVTESFATNESVQMFDVEVFSEEHQWFGNGVAVHNSQGSAPKGAINFKGVIGNKDLNAFRRHWYQMLSGVEGAWRTPIMNAAEGVEWIDMNKSNRDMEYNAWFDFLIKVTCSAFDMDPIEINFKYGNTGQSSTMNEGHNRDKIMESRERGLLPLLRFLESCLNRYVIWPVNDSMELSFVGLNAENRRDVAERNKIRASTTDTVNELRAEDGKDPIEGGDVLLDPTYAQMLAQAQQSAAMAEQGGDPESGGGLDAPDDGDIDFVSLLDGGEGGDEPDVKKSRRVQISVEV